MKIITVTLNPAFDMHCYAENFQPFHENLATVTACEAGGKGVNISRALLAWKMDSTAVVAVGEENGEGYLRALAADGMDVCAISVAGRIRENITLHTNNAPETRISFSGFSADDGLLASVEKEIAPLVGEDTILAFAGRNPAGVGLEAVKELLLRMKARGARLVIDSRSFGTADILALSPWLIKPNEEEIAAYTDLPAANLAEAARAAEALRGKGIENVMISLGEKGAVLASADGCFAANAPKIEALSTIGAGDSAIGGFCAAAARGKSSGECLQYAVASGSAACMTVGTRPPRNEDIMALLGQITVGSI